MTRNPERRSVLVDAAIEVLARDGARGLTFRSVDSAAGVPGGTASNYFTSRSDLLAQVAEKIHVRLAPDAAELAETMAVPRARELVHTLMRQLARRIADDRTGYLALLELRLEATRRPDIRASLTRTIRANLDENIGFHHDAGLPGGHDTVVALYFAMSGLIVEYLTLPEVLSFATLDALVDLLVERIVPER